MAKIQLTKRVYLGEGYVHKFKNIRTGEIKYVPCSKEEYERMAVKGGVRHNPTLLGYEWLSSAGGTIKVDTPDTMLGENEYVVVGDKAIISTQGRMERVMETAVIINNEVDDILWR